MDPRLRIHTKMSLIRNTVKKYSRDSCRNETVVDCLQGARSVQLADNWPRLQRGAHGPEGGGVRLTRQDLRDPRQGQLPPL